MAPPTSLCARARSPLRPPDAERTELRDLNRTPLAGLENNLPAAPLLNALVQLLYYAEPLRAAVVAHQCERPDCLVCELAFLFHMLDTTSAAAAAPRNFLHLLRCMAFASGDSSLAALFRTSLPGTGAATAAASAGGAGAAAALTQAGGIGGGRGGSGARSGRDAVTSMIQQMGTGSVGGGGGGAGSAGARGARGSWRQGTLTAHPAERGGSGGGAGEGEAAKGACAAAVSASGASLCTRVVQACRFLLGRLHGDFATQGSPMTAILHLFAFPTRDLIACQRCGAELQRRHVWNNMVVLPSLNRPFAPPPPAPPPPPQVAAASTTSAGVATSGGSSATAGTTAVATRAPASTPTTPTLLVPALKGLRAPGSPDTASASNATGSSTGRSAGAAVVDTPPSALFPNASVAATTADSANSRAVTSATQPQPAPEPPLPSPYAPAPGSFAAALAGVLCRGHPATAHCARCGAWSGTVGVTTHGLVPPESAGPGGPRLHLPHALLVACWDPLAATGVSGDGPCVEIGDTRASWPRLKTRPKVSSIQFRNANGRRGLSQCIKPGA